MLPHGPSVPVWAYDPDAATWTEVTPLPASRDVTPMVDGTYFAGVRSSDGSSSSWARRVGTCLGTWSAVLGSGISGHGRGAGPPSSAAGPPHTQLPVRVALPPNADAGQRTHGHRAAGVHRVRPALRRVSAVAAGLGSVTVRTWYRYDGQNNVRSVADWTGAQTGGWTYDAWGTVRAATGSAGAVPTFGYDGQQQDAGSGLLYLRARQYDAVSGRFVQEDPGRNGGDWYTYAFGAPSMATDPCGLCYYMWTGSRDVFYMSAGELSALSTAYEDMDKLLTDLGALVTIGGIGYAVAAAIYIAAICLLVGGAASGDPAVVIAGVIAAIIGGGVAASGAMLDRIGAQDGFMSQDLSNQAARGGGYITEQGTFLSGAWVEGSPSGAWATSQNWSNSVGDMLSGKWIHPRNNVPGHGASQLLGLCRAS